MSVEAQVPTGRRLAALRVSQLRETARTLERVAAEMDALADLDDVSDPLDDLAMSIRVVREDLDALETLGYRVAA